MKKKKHWRFVVYNFCRRKKSFFFSFEKLFFSTEVILCGGVWPSLSFSLHFCFSFSFSHFTLTCCCCCVVSDVVVVDAAVVAMVAVRSNAMCNMRLCHQSLNSPSLSLFFSPSYSPSPSLFLSSCFRQQPVIIVNLIGIHYYVLQLNKEVGAGRGQHRRRGAARVRVRAPLFSK